MEYGMIMYRSSQLDACCLLHPLACVDPLLECFIFFPFLPLPFLVPRPLSLNVGRSEFHADAGLRGLFQEVDVRFNLRCLSCSGGGSARGGSIFDDIVAEGFRTESLSPLLSRSLDFLHFCIVTQMDTSTINLGQDHAFKERQDQGKSLAACLKLDQKEP